MTVVLLIVLEMEKGRAFIAGIHGFEKSGLKGWKTESGTKG